MSAARPSESAGLTPSGKKEAEPNAAATTRGRRLGKGARRDVRWAIRQHPGDNVRDMKLHGVTITYHNASKDARENRSDHREDGRDKSHAEKAEKNSAQRRSEARAKKYYSSKRSATMAPSEEEGARKGAHDDDVAMIDTSGSGRGTGEKSASALPRSGRGRGGSK